MRLLFSLFILFGFSGSALAADVATISHFPADAAKTRFEILLEWFNSGVPATFEQVRGSYSGRCFFVKDKNNPGNSLLIGVEYNPDGDVGPGFPADHLVQKVVTYYHEGGAPGYFDDRTSFDYKDVLDRAPKSKRINPVEFPPLSSTLLGEKGEPWLRLEYVTSQNFLVVKMIAKENGDYPNWWGGKSYKAKSGDIVSMCYYFKKLD